MIRNPDGSPYSVSGTLQTYKPCDQTDKELFNRYDAEIIRINGTPIYYYELFLDSNNIDPLYREARAKVWSQNPVCLYGFYDPITSQNYVNMFGIDSPDEVIFEFNYQAVLQALGHKPKIGSRLFTPHKREHWEIKQTNVADWKMWSEIRLQVICDRFQETLSTGEGKVTKDEPPYKIC